MSQRDPIQDLINAESQPSTLTPDQREELFDAMRLIENIGDPLRRIRAIGDLMRCANADPDEETLCGLGECLVDLCDGAQKDVDQSHRMVGDVWEPNRIGKREAREAGGAR